MRNYLKPAIALILGILPAWVFIGTSNRLVVNGDVVSESHFNLGGIVLALIGIGLAIGVIKARTHGALGPKLLAGIAAVVCALQILHSSEVLRIQPLDWLWPDRHIPNSTYTGLAADERFPVSNRSNEGFEDLMVFLKDYIIGRARLHHAYAEQCHGGRDRIELARAEALPDLFSEEMRAKLNSGLRRFDADPLPPCSRKNSIHLMGKMADATNRDLDIYDRLVDDYRAFLANSRPD
ncbi:hypothetical protein HOY34_10985 [Xinfangfangia sp. D13-10-4-6]|uniref:hypothetical protein n=1 Tax=Pseudogemmobacter hezensis TaxID=2737662 RepID=UPI00155523A1|nr:hypothetical protein [Pseudogemmobacter hezensis]NPD15726.1 hypothetical protein [Pseudogemmobacter hezensis]